MKASKIGLVLLMAAGMLLSSPLATAGESEDTQENRFLGDRWNVRLFGNVTWYFLRNFGVGLGLSGSDVVYENTGGSNRIKVDLRQTSFTLNASLIF